MTWSPLLVVPRCSTSASIGVVEAVYELSSSESDWLAEIVGLVLPTVPEASASLGVTYSRPPAGGKVESRTWRVAGTNLDLRELTLRAGPEVPMDVQREYMRPGLASTVSEISSRCRAAVESWSRHVGIAKDALVVNAVEPDGEGVNFTLLLPRQTRLTSSSARTWRMLGAHLTAGHRIRRAMENQREKNTTLPRGAEAVIDPTTFQITDAEGEGRGATVALREAARRVDRSRGRLRTTDPEEALSAWWALMQGRWSMVDWFDSDDRRYVLAIPNAPNLGDPRGLTERELQVATYAALGEQSNHIGYRLGVSTSAVSRSLQNAMRKLGAKSQAQLVEKMRGIPRAPIEGRKAGAA
ncbi:MAG: helix-turn-helix transcriptional regulator [Polyangiales bacterium]